MLRTITRRVTFGSLVFLGLMVLMASSTATNFLSLGRASEHLTRGTLARVNLSGDFDMHLRQALIDAASFARGQGGAERQEALAALAAADRSLRALDDVQGRAELLDPGLHRSFGDLQTRRRVLFTGVRQAIVDLIKAVEAGDAVTAERLLNEAERLEELTAEIQRTADALLEREIPAATSTVEAQIRAGIVSSTISISILTLAILVVIWRLRFFVARPLRLLAATAAENARSGPEHTVAVTHKHDEIGDLQRAFNHMVTTLRQQQHMVQERTTLLQAEVAERRRAEAELKRAKAELELRVQERTAALEETNHQLSIQLRERERAQQALEAAKETALKASQAKSEFLSRMSHELRTPLNAILGFAQLLKRTRLAPLQEESVQQILGGGHHLLHLINEVLDITRVEAGRLDLEIESVSLPRLVQECLDLMRPLAQSREVTLHARLPASQPYVRADRQRLKQLLLNLVSNAVKYNRSGGSVTLTASARSEEQLRLEVSDTGRGIPRDRLPRLFEPFDRLGYEHSEIEGAGLGLAVVRRLADAMGLALGVESTVGEGSTFWIELPCAPAPEGELVPPSPLVPLALDATVLYIEDNLLNFQLVEQILASQSQIKLLRGTKGGSGLELARAHMPELILLDLHLPDLPGTEVLRHLQADPVTSAIPVVVISADALPGQIQSLLSAGARAYLTKPLDLDQFLTTVELCLSTSARHSTPAAVSGSLEAVGR